MNESDPPASLQRLYSEHHGWLYGWLYSRLGCRHNAADLAQDTYLRLLVSGNLPQIENSRRYLVRIAQGLMIDRYRRQRIEAAYLETLALQPEGDSPGPEEQLLIVEALLEIDAMLERMPGKVRQALLLRQLDGLGYKEIAARMGVSVSSVEKYVARGLVACYQALSR